MNNTFPMINNLRINASVIFQDGWQQAQQWAGHGIKVIKSIPQQLQQNSSALMTVIVTVNLLFFGLLYNFANYVESHINAQMDRSSDPHYKERAKNFLVYGGIMGGGSLVFNTFLGSVLNFSFNPSILVAISIANMVGRKFIKEVKPIIANKIQSLVNKTERHLLQQMQQNVATLENEKRELIRQRQELTERATLSIAQIEDLSKQTREMQTQLAQVTGENTALRNRIIALELEQEGLRRNNVVLQSPSYRDRMDQVVRRLSGYFSNPTPAPDSGSSSDSDNEN